MKKEGIEKDSETLALMCRFVRLKRGISQTDVAGRYGTISQATVANLERQNIKKVSAKNFGYVLQSLGMHPASLKDRSLFDWINEDASLIALFRNKYPGCTDTILKLYCAVFDAYAALLGWNYNFKIAEKSENYRKCDSEVTEIKNREKGPRPLTDCERYWMKVNFPDYLPSLYMYDVIRTLPEDILLDIFSIDENGLDYDDLPESFEEDLFEDVLSNRDPFKKFMRHLQIPFVDYFEVIDKIVKASDSIRASNFEALERNTLDMISNVVSIIYPAFDVPTRLQNYIKAIGASRDDILDLLRRIDGDSSAKGEAEKHHGSNNP
jgi:transcriptional regulator with XRE-family HTH domain